MIDTAGITLDSVLQLYHDYGADLRRVRRYQQLLYEERFSQERIRARADLLMLLGRELVIPMACSGTPWAQLDDLDCERTYLLLRAERPETVVEISPCGGWSSSWICNALRDNGHGRVLSFDVHDDSVRRLPRDLVDGIREFHLGDVRQSQHLPAQIDFLFMDSDHSAAFAEWYVREVFPRVRSGAVVVVDDVFHAGGPAASGGEGTVVLDWLAQRGIEWFTSAPSVARGVHAAVQAVRQGLSCDAPIVPSTTNPAIAFRMP